MPQHYIFTKGIFEILYFRQSQLSSGYQQQGGSCQYQQYHNTDAPSGFQPSASMPKPKPTAKDIYGNAKIVDTSERLRQIESKIARERKGTVIVL